MPSPAVSSNAFLERSRQHVTALCGRKWQPIPQEVPTAFTIGHSTRTLEELVASINQL